MSGLWLWYLVLLGSLVGGLLRIVTLANQSDKSIGKNGGVWWIRRGVEIVSGLATGAGMFVALTLLRSKPFDVIDPNSLFARLMSGGIGGLLGASGIAALVNRLLGLKEPEAKGSQPKNG